MFSNIQVFVRLMFINEADRNTALVSAIDNKTEFAFLNNGADIHKRKEMTLFMTVIFLTFIMHYMKEAAKVPNVNYVEEKEKFDLEAMKWEMSNSRSLHIMNHTISSEINNAAPDSVYAKEYLASTSWTSA